MKKKNFRFFIVTLLILAAVASGGLAAPRPVCAAVSLSASAKEDASAPILWSKIPTVPYTVKRGDSLDKIAKRSNTTPELLQKLNALSDNRLSAGRQLKVPSSRLSLVVDKSQNTMILKSNEEVLKTYVVSTGKNNCTPVGDFKITAKLMNPTWYRAHAVIPPNSPDNILGTRWLGLTAKGYGIHGTTQPEALGQQVTAGCIRLKNQDVEELYGVIGPGTDVTIVD